MATNINFNVMLKLIQQKGNLAWEYNPFRNYRLDQDMLYYKNQLWTYLDFLDKFYPNWCTNITSLDEPASIIINYKHTEDSAKKYLYDFLESTSSWYDLGLSKAYSVPIPYQKGQLVDFITDEFDYDLNHPLQLLPSYSYDNSVDLIINDGNTSPKLINSRFSALGKNKYEIINRSGNNDTNIYDKGEQFDIDTSLYKITTKIPEITFAGVGYGGNLKIGNYFFYFKYADADGNESDFVGSSGLVSIFIGNTPDSIHSGFRNQNSTKRVKFLIENTDQTYQDLIVYYTRATSDIYENETIETYKILQKFKIQENKTNSIIITGFEEQIQVSDTEVNSLLQFYNSAQSQVFCQNRLFLGNVVQEEENYDKLLQCALNIYPELDGGVKCEVNNLSSSYNGDITNTYYDPHFIYNHVGYWDDEIYRFGVVFIKANNTLSYVYNVRGLDLSDKDLQHIPDNDYDLDDGDYKVEYDSYNYQIVKGNFTNSKYENGKGVSYIPNQDRNTVIGIKFHIPKGVYNYLRTKLGIKGLFFVRQKRIPTTLCQAYTIGVESNISHIPVLEDKSGYFYESFLTKDKQKYVYFEDADKKTDEGYILTHDFSEHKRSLKEQWVRPWGAICPDYDVNYPYLNSLFTGGEFIVQDCDRHETQQVGSSRLFEVESSTNIPENLYKSVKIVGIEDNTKLMGIDDCLMSARAGEAEEARHFAWVGQEYKKESGGNNIARGSFGPYLGIVGFEDTSHYITIKIPGYDRTLLSDYFLIRANDKAPFYAISDRLIWDSYKWDNGDDYSITCYRGDCYISKFTHRVNRNFIDPSTPTNTVIVDPNSWDRGISFEDEVLKPDDLDNINLGDINAVDLGMWITLTIRSNINHSVRSLDESNVDEKSLFGHSRGFFPYHPTNPSSSYKIPDCGSYNKGFGRGVSEQISIQLPDVPYIRNNFSTRIAYSNIKITDSFQNSYRVFPGTYYRDYPINYGSITKLLELNGSIICVLEHGIFRIPVNERAVAAKGDGGLAYINTQNVLPENPDIISDVFGSQWADSIIQTPAGIYGVDTIGKKIWKVDRSGGFTLLSDFRIQEFLNNNITFSERELTPIIGIRNVKTHYNNFKHDVIFTFYDDNNTFEETAWSLCWNEILGMWITFYSWIPSFSENIYNQFFSFDRRSSKYIAKLGMSVNKDWADGFYLDNVIMKPNIDKTIGTFKPRMSKYEGTNVNETYKFELQRDIWGNHNKFTINKDGILSYIDDYSTYVNSIEENITSLTYNKIEYKWVKDEEEKWKWEAIDNSEVSGTTHQILNQLRYKKWKESFQDKKESFWDKIPVYYLNVRMYTKLEYEGTNSTYEEFIATNKTSRELEGGYVDYTIAVIPQEHLDALSTDFWKHGQAGIIDITEEVKPTKWYGDTHPFEFEFVVNEKPMAHKIFDSLRILSNNAEPESFHYEIVGDSYEFAKDKKNMYIRQEATKELYQYNGTDISYDPNYLEVTEEHRVLEKTPERTIYDKSTLFPLYYSRQDKIDAIKDTYHIKKDTSNESDYSALAGAEIVRYKNLDEYRIWNHAKAVDMKDNYSKGNMRYKEDSWYVQINPLNIVQKNEDGWDQGDISNRDSIDVNKIPIELGQSPIPDEILNNDKIDIPEDSNRGVVTWKWEETEMLEAKIKDKWVKIRVRYSGEKLAIIQAIQTLFSISYS